MFRTIFHLYSGRVHEPHFRALPLLIDTKTPFCIDIGGNIGQSVVSLKTLFPGAIIHSFEPVPATYRKLAAVAHFARAVTAHNVALGATSATMRMHVPYCEGVPFDQFASFGSHDPAELAPVFQRQGFDWVRAKNIRIVEQDVAVTPLDEFSFAPDFIKIDAEGAEFDVLKGGRQTIERSRPVLMIEGHHGSEGPIGRYLDDLGYRSYAFRNNKFDANGPIDYHNMFYVHQASDKAKSPLLAAASR